MRGGAAPRSLLGVLALILAIAVAVVPVVEARPKDRNTKQDEVATETVPAGDSGQSDVVYGDDAAAAAEQPLTVGSAPDRRTNGPCSISTRTATTSRTRSTTAPVSRIRIRPIQTVTGMATPARSIRTRTATLFPTNRTTARTSPPLTSPTVTATASVTPVTNRRMESSRNQNQYRSSMVKATGERRSHQRPRTGTTRMGREIERPGRSRSRVRDRTETSDPMITTGVDSENEGVGGPPAQEEPPAEEPVRDNPRRNEELIAEAAASGELDAPPEPPPAPQRAWDEEAAADSTEWDSIVKIDAGAAADADSTAARLGDDEANDAGSRTDRQASAGDDSLDRSDSDVSDSRFARGWVRAKLLLQEELPEDEPTEDDNASDDKEQDAPAGDGGGRNGSAPVPVENGLVISGTEKDEGPPRATDRDSESGDAVDEPETGDESEPLDEPSASRNAGPGRRRAKIRRPAIPASSLRERTAAAATGRRAPPPRPRLSDSASRPRPTGRVRT